MSHTHGGKEGFGGGCEGVGCAGRLRYSTERYARRIAATEASTSSSSVDQLETEIRIAARPCQTVPPSQQVPSAWTRAMTSRVVASASPVSW